MKKVDFFGKYFLRDGDLKPEEINNFSWQHYNFTIHYCEYLVSLGMLFDDLKKAENVSKVAVALINGMNNRTFIDIAEAPQKVRIYISGPISGYDLEERRKAFMEIEERLKAQGYETVNPMKNGLPDEATTHEHMKRDIELLLTCDRIYFMKKWTHSKGCKLEFDVATAIGLPVMFEEAIELTEFCKMITFE